MTTMVWKNILWLGDGIIGDDTDGHIDDVARLRTMKPLVVDGGGGRQAR